MIKKILIIGGTGFLGFHFAKHCIKKNLKVISISRNKPKKIRNLKKVKYILSNIADKNKLQAKIKNIENITYVVNFGGEVNHINRKQTYSSHYRGLKNLLNALQTKKIKKFIQIGSGLEYGKSLSPQNESYILKPLSNYAKAKSDATKFLIKFHKKKNFPAIIVRPYQVYGPYQDRNRLIPIIINACLHNKKFPCSSGNQSRDFLYVDDFVKAVFKLLIKKNNNGEIFNIGYGKASNIKKLIIFINQKIKKGFPEFGKIKMRSEENLITFPCIKKIKSSINWKPQINLINGINKTINFYQKEL